MSGSGVTHGTQVGVLGFNEASTPLVDKFDVHEKDAADDILMRR